MNFVKTNYDYDHNDLKSIDTALHASYIDFSLSEQPIDCGFMKRHLTAIEEIIDHYLRKEIFNIKRNNIDLIYSLPQNRIIGWGINNTIMVDIAFKDCDSLNHYKLSNPELLETIKVNSQYFQRHSS